MSCGGLRGATSASAEDDQSEPIQLTKCDVPRIKLTSKM